MSPKSAPDSSRAQICRTISRHIGSYPVRCNTLGSDLPERDFRGASIWQHGRPSRVFLQLVLHGSPPLETATGPQGGWNTGPKGGRI